jgi:ketosteroid isomerase-like protein
VVQEFYLRYNAGDVDGVMELMADDVEYHDLALYQDAFKGKEAVRDYFEKV